MIPANIAQYGSGTVGKVPLVDALHGAYENRTLDCTIQRSPTQQLYRELQIAYKYFNNTFFCDELPECVITLQRRPRTLGYFCHQRFINLQKQQADEIALNPEHFAARTESGVLSTLVHEMAHLWQFHFGNPSRRGYHNRQWAKRMIALGLYPSDTGEPGGRETGDRMTHYIVEAGPFDLTCRKLVGEGFRLSWVDNEFFGFARPPITTKGIRGRTDRSNRMKFTCSFCGWNAWGKPTIRLICGRCHVEMVPTNRSSE